MPLPYDMIVAIDEGYNARSLAEAPVPSNDTREIVWRTMWMRGFRFKIMGKSFEDAINTYGRTKPRQ